MKKKNNIKDIKNNNVFLKKNKPLLEVENLNMSFKKRGLYFEALKNVSFSVDEGDFFGIIGESGSGKSTTGKCIIKLYQPTGGKIEIENHLVSNKRLSRKTNKWLRKNVQMIFQDPMASLNPTKNILQLISEPLIINKSLYKSAISYWKKMNNVAKYYLLDFIKTKNYLVFDFKIKYLTLLIEKLKQTINNWETNFNELDDYKIIREKLIFKMDTLIENVQENSPLINEFTDKFQSHINELMNKYDKGEYHEIFKKYEQKLIELTDVKHIYKYSNEGYLLKKKIDEKKKNVKNYISNYKETYKIQNFGYIKSWETTIKSNIKNLSQNANFSIENLTYTINYINLTIQKFLLIFVKELKNNKYLEEEEINSTIYYSNQIVERMFEPINEKVQELIKQFENSNVDEKNIIINNLKASREIANILYLNFKNNIWNNYDFVKNQFNEIYNRYPHFTIKNRDGKILTFSNFDNDFKNLCSIYEDLKSVKDILKNNSNQKHKEFLANKKELISEIFSLKADLTILLKLYKEEKNELINNKDKYLLTKSEYKNLEKEKEKYFEEFIFANMECEIQNNTKNIEEVIRLKNELKLLFNELKLKINNSFYFLKKHYKNNTQIKNLDYFKFFKEKCGFVSSLKKEISMRKRSIDALNFEFKNSLNESKINSFIFETPRYINWISILNLINLMKKDKVYKALDSVGLKREHAYRYPHEFSGGQRQRIVIARALINNPKIIIADEPISALDVSIQAQIINILQDLCKKQNVTILFIAHDLSMVNYACNNVIIMHRGRILEKGNVNKIFENPIHPYTKSLMNATPKLSRVHVDLAAFNENFTYDKEWSTFNKPSFFNVNGDDDHQVFGLQTQVESWISESNSDKK